MASLVSIFLFAFVVSRSSCFSDSSRKELRDRKDKSEMVIDLGHPSPPNRINPSKVVQLSWGPRVFLYRSFLSDEECDHLMLLGHGSRNIKLGIDDDLGNTARRKHLLGLESLLDTKDEIVARIEERISAWSFLPKEMGKPIQLLHFGLEAGDQKYDYYGKTTAPTQTENLVATLILYLTNATRGGEILFPSSKLNGNSWSDCSKINDILTPIKGNAVLFFSLHLDASLDEKSSHARCPVLEGEMWCATKLFHIKAAGGEKIPSDSDDGDCTDEDDNCPRWAAMGECKRNPVYMIGSPDYFGTCRKSCNAC